MKTFFAAEKSFNFSLALKYFSKQNDPGNSYDAPLYLEEGWIYSEWEPK